MRIMYLLPLFLLAACASDPLELETRRVTAEVAGDGYTAIELADSLVAGEEARLIDTEGDFSLRTSIKFSEGAAATLIFPDGSEMSLPDFDLAGDGDTLITKVGAVSPGFWHELEVTYRADPKPTLGAVYLDGNPLYYQYELGRDSALTGGYDAVAIKVERGTVDLRDARATDVAGMRSSMRSDGSVILNLPIIDYAYYEFEPDSWNDLRFTAEAPARTGSINRFNQNAIRKKRSHYAIRYTAPLYVPRGGRYVFGLESPTDARLYIDDELVVEKTGLGWLEEVRDSLELSEGSHTLRVDYIQHGGWTHFELFYVDPGGYEAHLNDLDDGASVGLIPDHEPLVVETDDRPYLLRSFLNFPPPRIYDLAQKRTHVLSVGEGEGPHYSVDLDNGSLLQVWRGAFADAHDMWVGRGQPQVARPLGPPLPLGGDALLATSEEGPWAGSDGSAIRHLRHTLDGDGRPTFFYRLNENEVADLLIPSAGNLERRLSNGGPDGLFTLLAGAREIVELAPGSFELRGPGARIDVLEYPAGGLVLLDGDDEDRLVAELPASGNITYSINW